MLTPLSFTSHDRFGVPETDRGIGDRPACDEWIRSLFINATRDVFDGLPSAAPALAMPYNCGTVIATRSGRMIGIDLALIDRYYDDQDWRIPGWLYGLVASRLDMLIVSHGHLDHCWVELIWAMIDRGKPVIIPRGMRPCRPKNLPWGCWGVEDGSEFWWGDMHFAFTITPHVYDDGRGLGVLTTRLWDGERVYLHTSDGDTTHDREFRWYDRYPVDVLCFKLGGVSPYLDEYAEMERAIERVKPRRLILPMHLSELGHRGTEAAMPYSRAYDLLGRYRAEGKLADRRYGVLFGNRVVRF